MSLEQIALNLLNEYGLIGVLIVTFISYSIIPFPSEFIVIGASLFFNPFLVFIFALIGSTLGSVTTYYIGFKGIRSFFPKKESKKLKKAEKLFNQYGNVSILFFSWLPFIGDPLILIAGSLKMKFWKFFIYSLISRATYMAIIIWLGIKIESLI